MMIAAVATLLAAVLGCCLWWRFSEVARARGQKRKLHGRKILPSPCRLLPKWLGFLGGHTLLIGGEQITQQLEGWAGEFGGDYELNIFGGRMVVVTGLTDIRSILMLRPSTFKKDLSSGILAWAGDQAGLYPNLSLEEGKSWSRSRRLISPSLSRHQVPAMLPVVAKIGERLCAKLGEQADAEEIVDAKEMLDRFNHDVISLGLFGMDVDSLRASKDRPCPSFEAMRSALETMTDIVTKPGKMIGWMTLSSLLPWVRRVKEHSAQARDFLQAAIEAAREANQRESGVMAKNTKADFLVDGKGASHTDYSGTFIRKIVKMTKDEKESGVNTGSDRMKFAHDEIFPQMKGIFTAGTETTSVAISWALYYLTKHPRKFARCREEARRVAPTSAGMPRTSDQHSKLVFCSAAFKEALRLRPLLPFLFLSSTEDRVLSSGLKVKKGTSFSLLTRVAAMSEEIFTRPTEFVPERWIDAEREAALVGEGNSSGKDSVRHQPDAFLGFGAGPRACPGQSLAMMDGVAILAAIAARFDTSMAPGQSDPPEEIFKSLAEPRQLHLVFKRKAEA